MLRLSAVFVVALAACFACTPRAEPPTELILATTTSVYETGLLDSLIDRFDAATGIQVKPIAVGSGAALMMAARGDADAVLTHDPEAEAKALAAGDLIRRVHIMHNDFLLVGPATDPVGAKDAPDLLESMRRVAARGTFVSRGDASGTETRERMLWKAAGLSVDSIRGRIETGQGMSATLYVTNERQAYTLVDRGTWLTLHARVTLIPIADGDPRLLNQYSSYAVNPARHPGVKVEAASRWLEFLVTPEIQRYIGDYGRARLGGQLFVPDALRE